MPLPRPRGRSMAAGSQQRAKSSAAAPPKAASPAENNAPNAQSSYPPDRLHRQALEQAMEKRA
eukprot:4510149-Pyramimonas_sp.AAC.1